MKYNVKECPANKTYCQYKGDKINCADINDCPIKDLYRLVSHRRKKLIEYRITLPNQKLSPEKQALINEDSYILNKMIQILKSEIVK